MAQKKRVSKGELKKLLIDNSILDGIHQGLYTPVVNDNSPSNKIRRGRSLIISYYLVGQYVCTKHELRTNKGVVKHQDVETVVIGDTRYDRLD